MSHEVRPDRLGSEPLVIDEGTAEIETSRGKVVSIDAPLVATASKGVMSIGAPGDTPAQFDVDHVRRVTVTEPDHDKARAVTAAVLIITIGAAVMAGAAVASSMQHATTPGPPININLGSL